MMVDMTVERNRLKLQQAMRVPPAVSAASTARGTNDVYEVHKITGMRMVGNQLWFRVRWKGYSKDMDTWEPRDNLTHCEELLDDYVSKVKDKNYKQKKKKQMRKALLVSRQQELKDGGDVSGRVTLNGHVAKKRKKKFKAKKGNTYLAKQTQGSGHMNKTRVELFSKINQGHFTPHPQPVVKRGRGRPRKIRPEGQTPIDRRTKDWRSVAANITAMTKNAQEKLEAIKKSRPMADEKVRTEIDEGPDLISRSTAECKSLVANERVSTESDQGQKSADRQTEVCGALEASETESNQQQELINKKTEECSGLLANGMTTKESKQGLELTSRRVEECSGLLANEMTTKESKQGLELIGRRAEECGGLLANEMTTKESKEGQELIDKKAEECSGLFANEMTTKESKQGLELIGRRAEECGGLLANEMTTKESKEGQELIDKKAEECSGLFANEMTTKESKQGLELIGRRAEECGGLLANVITTKESEQEQELMEKRTDKCRGLFANVMTTKESSQGQKLIDKRAEEGSGLLANAMTTQESKQGQELMDKKTDECRDLLANGMTKEIDQRQELLEKRTREWESLLANGKLTKEISHREESVDRRNEEGRRLGNSEMVKNGSNQGQTSIDRRTKEWRSLGTNGIGTKPSIQGQESIDRRTKKWRMMVSNGLVTKKSNQRQKQIDRRTKQWRRMVAGGNVVTEDKQGQESIDRRKKDWSRMVANGFVTKKNNQGQKLIDRRTKEWRRMLAGGKVTVENNHPGQEPGGIKIDRRRKEWRNRMSNEIVMTENNQGQKPIDRRTKEWRTLLAKGMVVTESSPGQELIDRRTKEWRRRVAYGSVTKESHQQHQENGQIKLKKVVIKELRSLNELLEFQRNIRNGITGNQDNSDAGDCEDSRFEDRDVRTLEIQNRLVLRIRKGSLGRIMSEAWDDSETEEEEEEEDDDDEDESGAEEEEEMEDDNEVDEEDKGIDDDDDDDEGESQNEEEEQEEIKMNRPQLGLSPRVSNEDELPRVLISAPSPKEDTYDGEIQSVEKHYSDSKEEDNEKEGRKDEEEMMEGIEEEGRKQLPKETLFDEGSEKNTVEESGATDHGEGVGETTCLDVDSISGKGSEEKGMVEADEVQLNPDKTNSREMDQEVQCAASSKDNNKNTISSLQENTKQNISEETKKENSEMETNIELETGDAHLTNKKEENDYHSKDNCSQMDIDELQSTAKRKGIEKDGAEVNKDERINRLEEKEKDKMETETATGAVNVAKSVEMECALRDATSAAVASILTHNDNGEESKELDVTPLNVMNDNKIMECAQKEKTNEGIDSFIASADMVVDPNEVGGTVTEKTKTSEIELPKNDCPSTIVADRALDSGEKPTPVSIEETEVVNKLNGELTALLGTAPQTLEVGKSSIGGLEIAKEVEQEIFKMLEPSNSMSLQSHSASKEKHNTVFESKTQIHMSGTAMRGCGAHPMETKEQQRDVSAVKKDSKSGNQKTSDSAKINLNRVVTKRKESYNNNGPKESKIRKSEADQKSCGVRGRNIQRRVKVVNGDKAVVNRDEKEGTSQNTSKTATANMEMGPNQVRPKEGTMYVAKANDHMEAKQEGPKNFAESKLEIDPDYVGPKKETKESARESGESNINHAGQSKGLKLKVETGPKQVGPNEGTHQATNNNVKMDPKQAGPKVRTNKAPEVNMETGPKQIGPKKANDLSSGTGPKKEGPKPKIESAKPCVVNGANDPQQGKTKDRTATISNVKQQVSSQQGLKERTPKAVEYNGENGSKQGMAKVDSKKGVAVNRSKGPNQDGMKEPARKPAALKSSDTNQKPQQAMQAKPNMKPQAKPQTHQQSPVAQDSGIIGTSDKALLHELREFVKYGIKMVELVQLRKYLDSADPECLTEVCSALTKFMDSNDIKINLVVKKGFCPSLVKLLRHSSMDVVSSALLAVSHIVSGNDYQTQSILECNALPLFCHFLDRQRYRVSIRKEACLALSNITAGTSVQIQHLVTAGLFPVLLEAILNDEFLVQYEATWAVANATVNGSPEQIKYIVTQGFFRAFCEVLKHSNEILIQIALDAILNVLKLDSKTTSAPGRKGVGKSFCKQVKDHGGLQRIKNVRYYGPAIVRRKAHNLLSTFFKGEYEGSA